jgi:RNA polymerase sigma-70 factor (ECF subfamily)
MAGRDDASDAELMRRVAEGSDEALDALYRRFARAIMGLAAHSLDRAAAEDILQDVFMAIWRKAGSFDPERGTVRSWVMQIAHFRVLNELRRRSRQAEIEPDPDGRVLAAVPDRAPGPAEAAWRRHRRAIVESALGELPPAQREAVDMAFVQDLTHEEVAAALDLPLGTAKTRIRTGLQRLRARLLPEIAALVAVLLAVVLGVRQRAELAREERALTMVTASDSVNLRLAPLAGVAEDTHARYRARPGVGTAVVTLSKFPPAPTGAIYQAWARHGERWTSLGTARPDAGGGALLIAEDPALAAPPDALEVTLEPAGGSAQPIGRVVVAWTP